MSGANNQLIFDQKFVSPWSFYKDGQPYSIAFPKESLQPSASNLAFTRNLNATGSGGGEASLVDHNMQLLIGSEFLVRDDAGTPRFKLVLLAQNLNGYGNLSQFITRLRRASPVKGEYTLHWRQLTPERLTDCLALLVLPREAPDAELLAPAQWALQHFTGRTWLAVELLREASDALWLQRLQALSEATALPLVAAGDVHFHVRSRKALQDVMTATRLGRTVADCGFDLQPNAERHLRSRYRLSRVYPPALLAETLHVAARCDFSLDEIREMANQGNAWPLVEGTGRQYGLWVVTRVEETSTHFFRDGAAEKIEFNLTLEHVDDERTDLITKLETPVPLDDYGSQHSSSNYKQQ